MTLDEAYATLAINKNSSMDDVKASYRHLCKKMHPDVNKSPDASNQFIKLQQTYDFVLKFHKPKPVLKQLHGLRLYRLISNDLNQTIDVPAGCCEEDDVVILCMTKGGLEFRIRLAKGTKLPCVLQSINLPSSFIITIVEEKLR